MNRFLQLFRPLSASVNALCNVKYRTILSPIQALFKDFMLQIYSANSIGENDRDILDDSCSVLGFLAASVLVISLNKLRARGNDEDDTLQVVHSNNGSNKRNRIEKFCRTNSGSKFQQMERERSERRKLEILDENNGDYNRNLRDTGKGCK